MSSRWGRSAATRRSGWRGRWRRAAASSRSSTIPHAAFARAHLDAAGVGSRVEIRVGEALRELPALDGERFDLVFLDADKEPLPTYLDWALRLVRPGGIVVADNALWGGRVLDGRVDDAATVAVREFNRRLATDPRLTSIVVPTHDGVAIGVVRQDAPA